MTLTRPGRASPSRPRAKGGKRLRTPIIVIFSAVLIALIASNIPPYWNPFAPIDLTQPANLLTRFKLGRLENNPTACLAALKNTSLRHARVPDRPMEKGCGIIDAVHVSGSGVAFNNTFVATCPLVAAWAMFETHALQPAARRHYGKEVTRVVHGGTYACRNIVGRRRSSRRSQHAHGNAIDLSAFVLSDGTKISVASGWKEEGTAKAFLEDVQSGACPFFGAVLGPDFNAAHHDHFHFDRGPFHTCR